VLPPEDDPEAAPDEEATSLKINRAGRERSAITTDPELVDRRIPYARLTVNHEQRPGLGEDAKPVCLVRPPTGLVAVFDGLGGAGGEEIQMRDGPHSGAFVASRVVRRAVNRWAPQIQASTADDDDSLPAQPGLSSRLYHEIWRDISEMAALTGAGASSRLRSRLIKALPTTMALAWFDLDQRVLTALWAGDSRVYLLHPSEGLQQVTTDDLKTKADALENLTQDSPMSNFITAEGGYVLHERQLAVHPLTIVVAATDGCFGYVHTPLHFENMLLATMHQATSWDDWSARLTAAIKRVTGDDATLAAVAVGWSDIGSCQRDFGRRAQACEQAIERFESLSAQAASLEQRLGQVKSDLAQSRRQLWENYRESYEYLLRLPPIEISLERPAEDGPTPPNGSVAEAEGEAARHHDTSGAEAEPPGTDESLRPRPDTRTGEE
jgi:serine/threonine protein phosphatase PrpC